ncbi:MAG: RluA family pseudouridine synthase [Pirellulales bacterium]
MAESDLQILYEQGPCLVVLKPAGLLTQAPPGIDSIEVRIKEFLRRRDQPLGEVYLGVPHRLDRPVSGAMVFGKHTRATRRLGKEFEKRRVRKIYWACVEGEVAPAEGTWEDYLRKVPGEPRAEIVPCDHPEGRRAVLHYRTLGRTRWGSWLAIELETGRTHQVRIQAASRGWPILGDFQYGATTSFGTQYEDERLRAIALHARTLSFRHPMTRETVTVTAPLAEAWRELDLSPLPETVVDGQSL